MVKISTILEYLDFFGTKPGFYIEKHAKNYTVLGGIFSILSFIFSLAAFVYFSLDEPKMILSTVATSTFVSKNIGKINTEKENIYIPWRIVDQNKKLINHTNLIFPEIEYIQAKIQNLNNEFFEYKIQKLNYTLCNKTSMINLPNNYYLDIPLNNLYCINKDGLNLEIGGSWLSTFNNFFRIRMYLCKNNIDYDEKNPNCTNYEKLVEKIGKNNPLYIEFYYPTVQLQPTNSSQPIVLVYKLYYYKFNLYINKLDRLFLKKNILEYDGWFNNNIKTGDYWGLSDIKGDYYFNKKNIFNKNTSTSLLYTLLIYLDTDFVLYSRKFKKSLSVISEGLPIMYTVFIIFSIFAKIFKQTEETKIMMELLFENLKEKKNNFNNNFNNLINNKNRPENKISPVSQSNNNFIDQISDNKTPITNSNFNCKKGENIMKFQKNNINERSISKLKKSKSLGGNYLKTNLFHPSNHNKKYIHVLLFPYKYYFFSVFIKNNSILEKESCFFSRKFIEVYKYLAKIIDITTYLQLQREFYIFKTEVLDTQNLSVIERERKMNINDRFFSRYMRENDEIN